MAVEALFLHLQLSQGPGLPESVSDCQWGMESQARKLVREQGPRTYIDSNASDVLTPGNQSF